MRRFTRPPKRGFKLKPYEPKEGALHRSVAQWLDWMLLPPALYTTFPAGWGWLPKSTAGRLKGSGLKAGFPDILVFFDRRCVGIELKKRDGALTENQKVMRPLLEAAGVQVFVCRTVDEVVAVLVAQGFPMRNNAVMRVA